MFACFVDRLRVGRGRDTRQEDARVTYPESYITKYTTYTKKNNERPGREAWTNLTGSRWTKLPLTGSSHSAPVPAPAPVGLGVRASGFGVCVYGLWFMVYGLWFMVYGLWFMVYGLWFMVYGFGFRVLGCWVLGCRGRALRGKLSHTKCF